MLEQSLRTLFEQQAEADPPSSRVAVAAVLRQGRLRRRRHRIGAVGAPVLAAVAVAAIALPSAVVGRRNQPAASYGRFVGGAFDPSYLSIKFGWLPKGTVVASSGTSPGLELLNASAKRGMWSLMAYARSACDVNMAKRRFRCMRSAGFFSILGRGPLIDGHTSLWLQGGPATEAPTLAWEYAPGTWAYLWNPLSRGRSATVVRVARNVEFGQHIPVMFPDRITSLPRGWRITGLSTAPPDAYVVGEYTIGRLRTISPATPGGDSDGWNPGQIFIGVGVGVGPVPRGQGCRSGLIDPSQTKVTQVTVRGYRLLLGDLRTGTRGHVQSHLDLCGTVNGMPVYVQETGAGAHPHFALSPTQVVERLQLLGDNPANWVTNPLP